MDLDAEDEQRERYRTEDKLKTELQSTSAKLFLSTSPIEYFNCTVSWSRLSALLL